MSKAEEAERWYFTFGFDHTHPTTGERLSKCYVALDGDVDETRETMQRHFGLKWSMQYPSAEKAGVDKYGLERIDLPDTTPEVDRPQANHATEAGEDGPFKIQGRVTHCVIENLPVIGRDGRPPECYVGGDAEFVLRAMNREARASFREWQPIETAPKDTWQVVAHFKDGRLSWWYKAKFTTDGWKMSGGLCDPTHYLPLPDPPQGHKGTE